MQRGVHAWIAYGSAAVSLRTIEVPDQAGQVIDAVHGSRYLLTGAGKRIPQRGGCTVEVQRHLPRPVEDQLPRRGIVGVGAQSGERRKQVADALRNSSVSAGRIIRLHRCENSGQLIELPQLRVLAVNRALVEFIA